MWNVERARLFAAIGLVVLSMAADARSQPSMPIRIVVPLPPGGAGDILGRLLAEQIGRTHGQTVIVEDRPGAGSLIGAEIVSRAQPDGNTLLLNAPYLLINPRVRKVSYDPLTSFEPICDLVSSPAIIAVNGASPYHTLGEFLAAAHARPGELTLASVGPATAQHLGIEKLKHAAGVDVTYVPFTGGAPAINAALGGHVTAVFAEYAPLASHLKAGTLRALATSSRTRIERLPDLPTIAETGYPGFEVDLWWGLFAPAKTPKETLARLAGWFTAGMLASDTKAKLADQGFSPVGICGAEFGTLLRQQYDDYGRIVREANIKAE
jgi:tripartite-type tricarboxylate transporter receptor subunit TctC